MSRPSPDSGTPFNRPHPRFIAGLIGVAAVVLAVGATLRPATRQSVTTAVPSNELATLPERSQRRALRDMAEYVRDRATTFSKSVVYLPEQQTSALALGADSLLTVIPDGSPAGGKPGSGLRILLTSPPAADSTLQPAPQSPADTLPPGWGVVVARTIDGRTLTLAGLTGGVIHTFCGELGFPELVFDAPVPAAFRGGGLFDLDGNAVAQAVPCNGRIALVPLRDLLWALALQTSTEAG